jgi:hypothetical protein
MGSGKPMQKDAMPTSWKPKKTDSYETNGD